MAPTIEPFRDIHVGDAADLAVASYRALRNEMPLLPEAWESPERIAPLLARIVAEAPAVVAIDRGRLCGHLAGWVWPGRGSRWAFSPEWANSADGDDPRRVQEGLYTALAAAWLADGAPTHLISTPVTARAALESWSWLGFGVSTVDAVRPIAAIAADVPAGLRVRRAGTADLATFCQLEDGLRAHLAASPVFFSDDPGREAAEQERRLADPSVATFLAETDEDPIAYLRIGPVAGDVAFAVRDPSTASITGAYTRADRRGDGVATALLDRALAWAVSARYERCAVDFESMNVLARRFWMRWFTPVVLTLGRRL